LEYAWDGQEGRVMNLAKNNGFQIRSLKEFNRQQKIIKSEAKATVKVGAVTRAK
jgi:hypothetical protein